MKPAANHTPRLAVLISGSGSNLQAIIDACADGRLAAEVALVISNRADAYGLQRAERAGIPTRVIVHRDYADRAAFDQAVAEALDQAGVDWIVLAGFMRILTPEFVNHYLGRLVNIHPSLLPKYPGLDTHARALADGDRAHGATVHFVTPTVDAGPAIIQGQLAVRPDDDEVSLRERVYGLEHRIYPQALRWLTDGEVVLAGNQVRWHDQPLTAPAQLDEQGQLTPPATTSASTA